MARAAIGIGAGVVGACVAMACGTDSFGTNPSDASTDAATEAEGLPPVGGGDGGDAGDAHMDAAQQTFCQKLSPVPFFCSDWDEGSVTTAFKKGGPAAWVIDTNGSSGTVALSTTFMSPPASMTANMPNSTSVAFLDFTDSPSPSPSSVSIEFDLYVVTTTPGGMGSTFIIMLPQSPAVLALDTTSSPHALLVPSGGGTLVPTTDKIADGTWAHVSYTASLNGALLTSTVAINNGSALMVSDPTSKTTFSPFEVQVGGIATAGPQHWSFDNVTIRLP